MDRGTGVPGGKGVPYTGTRTPTLRVTQDRSTSGPSTRHVSGTVEPNSFSVRYLLFDVTLSWFVSNLVGLPHILPHRRSLRHQPHPGLLNGRGLLVSLVVRYQMSR